MTVPGMKKIFSAVAMTAAVVTLTLASADVLASGKGKDNGKSKANESSSQVVSSGKGNSNNGNGNSQSNGKGNGHDHSNSGKGHQHDHPGYINGVGHHKHHDHDDEDDGSCEAPDDDHDHDGKGKGHDNHKGKGHQHDHTGYINGVGHHKHHDHDDDEDCGGGDTGGGDTGGGDTGGGDNGGGVVLPEGCFMAAGYSDGSVTFASALNSTHFGFITPQVFGAEVDSVLVDADANPLGGVYSVVTPDTSYFLINSANNYAIRELRIFSGAPGSYALDAEYTYEWIGSQDLQIPGGEYELPVGISGESAETVIEAMICSTTPGNTGN